MVIILQEVIDLLENLIDEVPENPKHRRELAEVYNELAWFLATCPDPQLRDPRALDLAEMAVRQTPNSAACRRTLGVAQYRAGKWEECIESLQKSLSLDSGEGGPEPAFLAMAHWQLGHKDEARVWYDRYLNWLQKQPPGNEELQRFRKEAASLLALPLKSEI